MRRYACLSTGVMHPAQADKSRQRAHRHRLIGSDAIRPYPTYQFSGTPHEPDGLVAFHPGISTCQTTIGRRFYFCTATGKTGCQASLRTGELVDAGSSLRVCIMSVDDAFLRGNALHGADVVIYVQRRGSVTNAGRYNFITCMGAAYSSVVKQ